MYCLVEVIINKSKWIFISCYKPPKVSDIQLWNDLCCIMEEITLTYENCVIMGDINCDMHNVPNILTL